MMSKTKSRYHGRRSKTWNDVFAMNNPSGGTLFKRRQTAERVKKLLGKRISIVKFTTKGGELRRLSHYHGRWNKRRGRKG